ncbi:hypothetical protein [Roseospira goensis]|uniref:Uncharacterized protein n=1 Tax=Roseospira goensis TaxID=391922 RepID=A0A7W6RZC4_9PROT|nr:hypothetical protein [Roseospira goensis]MBB4285836.1 hypothetical protein [Roseospira goensis]
MTPGLASLIARPTDGSSGAGAAKAAALNTRNAAQTAARTGETGGPPRETPPDGRSQAAQTFLDLIDGSLEERYFEMLLAAKGYMREQFEALPPEKKREVDDAIRQEIRQKTKAKVEAGPQADPTSAGTAAIPGARLALGTLAATGHAPPDATAAGPVWDLLGQPARRDGGPFRPPGDAEPGTGRPSRTTQA